jgi:hypothetical protein
MSVLVQSFLSILLCIIRNSGDLLTSYCTIMIILSEKCLPSVISIPDDDFDVDDDDFITRGWHKVGASKEGDRSNEETCKRDVIDLRSDKGLYVVH